jgi:hypothetical protein
VVTISEGATVSARPANRQVPRAAAPPLSGGDPTRASRELLSFVGHPHRAADQLRMPVGGTSAPSTDGLYIVRGQCEHVFVTSDGSPYSRFRRALETGNELLVVAAAKELPQIGLEDALRICLVLRDGHAERYERAAVRWLGRFALEAHGVTIDALRAAADALDALPERPLEAMERLQAICAAHGVR